MVSWTLKFWQNYVYLYCSKLNIGYASDVFEDLFLSFSLSEETTVYNTFSKSLMLASKKL